MCACAPFAQPANELKKALDVCLPGDIEPM
jgi:hypothetical protein